MRLRKRNVSRVAAVAVAAVMAVSAAAPAAFAAAPAVNGGTAVVQENSTRTIDISYYNNDTGEFIRTGSVKVPVDATQITTDMLTDVPANWAVYPVGMPQNIDSDTKFVTIYLVPATPAPSEHVIDISYKNSETGEFIHTGSVKVSADATQITADMLTDVPANWVVDPVFVPLNINSDTKFVDIYCKPAVTEHEIVVTYRDNDTNAELGKETVKVLNSAEQLTAEMLQAVPANWKVYSASLPQNINSETASVDVYCVPATPAPTTKVVKINFYSEDEEKQIAELRLIVAANATSVNSSALTAPKGYELCEAGDFAIRDGYVYAAVRKATTKVVKINFYSEDEEKQIEESELTVAADATSVNSSELTAPKGYELCETGDFAIRDGYVYVAVRKVTTPDPVDPTPTPDPEPTPAPTVNPVTTALGVGAWLLALGGLILGFFGL